MKTKKIMNSDKVKKDAKDRFQDWCKDLFRVVLI